MFYVENQRWTGGGEKKGGVLMYWHHLPYSGVVIN